MKNKQVILLLSGGIDSTTLLAKLTKEKNEIIAVSFSYGQKHNIELDYAKQNAQKYNVKKHLIIELDKHLFQSSALVNKDINITSYENIEFTEKKVNAYVPFRNLIFISTALSLAESININKIYTAFNNDDNGNYWDCRKGFIDKINEISNSSSSSIQIKTPFIDLSKNDVVKLAKQLDVNLNNTITCYQPNKSSECGVCLSCKTKQKALQSV